jgi:hypothetical protein
MGHYSFNYRIEFGSCYQLFTTYAALLLSSSVYETESICICNYCSDILPRSSDTSYGFYVWCALYRYLQNSILLLEGFSWISTRPRHYWLTYRLVCNVVMHTWLGWLSSLFHPGKNSFSYFDAGVTKKTKLWVWNSHRWNGVHLKLHEKYTERIYKLTKYRLH